MTRIVGAALAALLMSACAPEAPEAAGGPEEAPEEAPDFIETVAWAPDGSRLAVSWYRGPEPRIYGVLVPGDAEAEEPGSGLLLSDGAGSWPTWSPDGLWIAYQRGSGEGAEIYRMRPDGTGAENLTRSPGADLYPAYSPDGSRIAFISERDGDGPRLWIMKADGSEPRRVPTRVEGDFSAPSWDPGGGRVSVQVTTAEGDFIYLVNPDDGSSGRLGRGTRPAWSPDGRRVVFVQRDSLFWRPPDGGARAFVVAGASAAAVAPDGQRLAFVRGAWPRSALYLLDVERFQETRITP